MAENRLRIIAGRWRSRRITFDDHEGLRPTPDRIREMLFNWLRDDVSDSVCLDLFAGSGALGFEAASRGAANVVMVERDKGVARRIRENVRALEAEEHVEVVTQDANRFVGACTTRYDIVFLDPPYRSSTYTEVCEALEQGNCLSEHAKIYLEHDAGMECPEVPANWMSIRSRQAGQVACVLFERVSG